jgi:alpha-glucosidase (family GH31 glycosyl hydrolase)
LPPSWAFGVWKNLIGGEALVEREIERLREEGVPIDAVWIYDAVDDRVGFGWPWQIFGLIRPGVYRDLTSLIHRLHRRGLKVLGYLHPFLYPHSDAYATARAHDFLVKTPDGRPYMEPWTFTPRAYLDFSNARATAWWQDRVCIALLELGFDGAMLDFGEGAPIGGRYAGGQAGQVMHNLYPVLYLRAAHEVGEAAKPGDAVFFARAGYSGSQPVTMARFPGDQVRSWDRDRGLPSLIPAMLSGGLSGWPFWGPDIAGFFDGDGIDLGAEKGLWLRWVQLGALSPTMRDMLGSQRDPVGVWTDEDTLAVFRAYARLHTALRPYLHRYAQLAHRRGLPILRPLFLNYPADSGAYAVDDAYLLGDDLLVAPVLAPAQTIRRLYLPADRWRDYWTGEAYDGPGWVTVAAPLGQIPLFVREGGELSLPRPEELAFPVVSATAGPARWPSR